MYGYMHQIDTARTGSRCIITNVVLPVTGRFRPVIDETYGRLCEITFPPTVTTRSVFRTVCVDVFFWVFGAVSNTFYLWHASAVLVRAR